MGGWRRAGGDVGEGGQKGEGWRGTTVVVGTVGRGEIGRNRVDRGRWKEGREGSVLASDYVSGIRSVGTTVGCTSTGEVCAWPPRAIPLAPYLCTCTHQVKRQTVRSSGASTNAGGDTMASALWAHLEGDRPVPTVRQTVGSAPGVPCRPSRGPLDQRLVVFADGVCTSTLEGAGVAEPAVRTTTATTSMCSTAAPRVIPLPIQVHGRGVARHERRRGAALEQRPLKHGRRGLHRALEGRTRHTCGRGSRENEK